MKRRTFVYGGGATLLLGAASPLRFARANGERQSSSGDPRLAVVESTLGGRVGVAAIDTGSGARLLYRANERFAMCSTFKWLLAAAVLARVDEGHAGLDQRLPLGPQDLLEYAPITSVHVAEGAMTIRALCAAAVEVSDNTAANLLLKFIGGPLSLTRYVRGVGDTTTRFDRTEPSLNENLPNDPRDTTTPATMISTMRKLLVHKSLSDASRAVLVGWMKTSKTGLNRLRAGLPPAWVAGDKTGTGENGATNDVAIVWPPNRPPILIAAYLSGSHADSNAREAAHARIGNIVAATFS